MSYSVAANTRLAGSAKGNFLDDLTNPNVGQWPKTQAIKKINRIVVYSGSIIDSLRITYQVEGAASPITITHGGNGGVEALSFDIGDTEKLVAVYGTRNVNPTPYGDKNIVRLSFVVVNSYGSVPTVKVYTGAGNSTDPTEKFDLSWALVAASSFTYSPPGSHDSFLQAIGFSKVLGQAGSPMVI